MLKQDPQTLSSRIFAFSNKENVRKCPYEHTLYAKVEDGNIVIACSYVCDLIYIENDVLFKNFK